MCRLPDPGGLLYIWGNVRSELWVKRVGKLKAVCDGYNFLDDTTGYIRAEMTETERFASHPAKCTVPQKGSSVESL